MRPSSAPPSSSARAAARSASAAALPFAFFDSGRPPLAAAGSSAAEREITEKMCDAAWRVLAGGQRGGGLSAKALLERLRLFQPSAALEDAQALLGEGGKVLTIEDIKTLLVGNSSLTVLFDPLREVVEGGALGAAGEATLAQLRALSEALAPAGGGARAGLCAADFEALLAAADADGDGRLGLDDVRKLLLLASK
jgi:hypothetical protein